MDYCLVIQEAECCSGKLAAQWADVATFGNDNQKLYYDWLALNCLIRTLKRNLPESDFKKEKVPITEQVVDFNALKRRNNVLFLDSKPEFRCIEIPIQKCLSDDELRQLTQNIKEICSNCFNCN